MGAFATDTINTVKEKAEAKANLVKQSLENSKDFAEEVLDSTGTLATEKFKKGEKFVKDIIEAKTQLHQDASEKTATFLKAIEEKATAKVEGIKAAISDKLAKSKAKIHFALEETVGVVKATGELLKEITKTKIDKVADVVKDVPEQVLDVKANLHKVKVEKIAATLKLNHELNKVARKAQDKIVDVVRTAQDEVRDGSIAFVEGLNEVKQDKIDPLKDIVSSKGELVQEAASKVVDKAKAVKDSTVEGAVALAETLEKRAVKKVAALGQNIEKKENIIEGSAKKVGDSLRAVHEVKSEAVEDKIEALGKLSSDVKDFKVETIQAVTESKDSIHDSLEEMVEIVAKTGIMVKEIKKGVKDAKLNAKTEAVEARLEKTQELLRSGVDSTIDVIKAAAETKKNHNERIGHVSERRLDVGQQGVREGEWKKRQRRHHHDMLKKDNAVQLTRSFVEAIGQAEEESDMAMERHRKFTELFSSDLFDEMAAEATTKLATELPNTTENPDEEMSMGRMVPDTEEEEEVDAVTNLVLEKHQKFTKLFSGDLLEGLGAGLNDNDAVKHETCDPEDMSCNARSSESVLIRKITAHGFKDRSDDSLLLEEDQDEIEDRVIEISVDEDDLDEVTEKTVELAKKRSVLDLLLGFFA